MKLKKLDIVLKEEKDTFYPGDVVHGTVILETTEDMKFKGIRVKFKGRSEVTTFIGDYDTERETYYSGHQLLVGKLPMDEGCELVNLLKGTYEYPFQFELPYGIPSSFHLHGDDHAKVSYTIDAIIHRPGLLNYYQRRSLNVRSHLDIQGIPDFNKEVRVDITNALRCLRFNVGDVTIKAHLLRKAYMVGEEIPVHAVIVNNSKRRLKKTEATLLQMIKLSVYGYETKKIRRLASISRGPIARGQSDEWVGEMLPVPDNLPPTGLEGCKLVDIQYAVELAAIPSGFCCKEVAVTMNIVIGSTLVPVVVVPDKTGPVSSALAKAPVSKLLSAIKGETSDKFGTYIN